MSCCCVDPCTLIFQLNRTVNNLQTQITEIRNQINGGTSPAIPEILKFHVQEQFPTGNPASDTLTTTWLNRHLNTIITNDIGAEATAVNNLITLPAGTYEVVARAPAVSGVERNRLRLVNNDTSSVLMIGANSYAANSMTDAVMYGRLTLSQTTTMALQQYTQIMSQSGMGLATSLAGYPETYAEIIFYKIS